MQYVYYILRKTVFKLISLFDCFFESIGAAFSSLIAMIKLSWKQYPSYFNQRLLQMIIFV